MSTAVLPPTSSDEAGPSTIAASNLTPLSELVRRSVKRTRAVYANESNVVDDGLAKACVTMRSTWMYALLTDIVIG